MKRIIGVALLGLLTIPALAVARAPATGALKQTITTAVANHDHLDVNRRQKATCFGVWTDRGYAVVEPNANAKPGWFAQGGRCDIYADGQEWQPDTAILKHLGKRGWMVLGEYDEASKQQLLRDHVPISVYENLTHVTPH